MSAAIGSFLTGLVEGRQRRRVWDAENEDREWQRNRRKRQETLDVRDDAEWLDDDAWEGEERNRSRTEWGQSDEDRRRSIAWEDESRSNERGNWGEQDETFRRTIEKDDYTTRRTRDEDARTDAARQVNEDAALAYGAAVQADRSPEPVVPMTEAPAQPGGPLPRSVVPPAPAAPSVAPPPAAMVSAPVTPPQGRSLATAPTVAPLAGAAQAGTVPAPAAPVAPMGGGQSIGGGASGIVPAPEPAAQQAPRSLPPSDAEVEQYAAKVVPSAMQAWREQEAPKVIQSFIAKGEYDKAEKFETFIDSKQTKEAMGYWMKGMAVAEIRPQQAMQEFARAYNVRGYFDDGIEVVPEKSSIARDPQTGVLKGTITFRDEQTGKMTEMPFEGTDDLYRMAAGLLAPEEVFARGEERLKAADERRAAQIDAQTPEARSVDLSKLRGEALKAIEERETGLTRPLGPDGKPLPPMTPAEMQAEAEARAQWAAGNGPAPSAPAAPGAASDDIPLFLR